MAKKPASPASDFQYDTDEEGFTTQSTVRGTLCYPVLRAGAKIRGYLFDTASKTVKGKVIRQLKILLTQPCEAKIPSEDKSAGFIDGTAEAGHIAILDEVWTLKPLTKLIDAGKKSEVIVQWGGKSDIGNGQTMWNAKVQSRVLAENEVKSLGL